MFIIDYSGVTELNGQNIFRRCINMFKRTDPLNYYKKLKPYCEKHDKMLNEDDIKKLQSIKIPNKTDFGIFSRKNTITHQCCKNYTKEETKLINDIKEKIRRKYEKKLNKKLYHREKDSPTIYSYRGNKSYHLWHVDPNNIDIIYNTITCIKKVGKISPLQCKDATDNINSIEFEEGDTALFRGGTTVHQVPPSDDPDSERIVLSIAFTTDREYSLSNESGLNLCTYIEGGNNYKNLFKIWALIFSINLALTHISGINKMSLENLTLLFIISLILAKYLPQYLDLGIIGSNRASSFYHNIIVLMVIMLSTFSIKGSIAFSSYFLLSDLFFKRDWVKYD